MNPRERIVRLLIRILVHPYTFTKRELSQFFNQSQDVIKDDLKVLRNIGLEIEYDKRFRYAILPDRQFKELEYLQPLSEEEKAKISRAMDYLGSGKDALYLQKKLSSLYDFQKLGLRSLRKPAIERIDRLAKAQNEGLQVVLENYRSRSNRVKDRIVEPFHLDPEKDTVQAYDLEAKDSRHFRLSRIERVHLSQTPWAFSNHHRVKITDVFRIADNQQVPVHLHLDVFAYNSLTEEFPLTLTYLESASAPNFYDFQCTVNHTFKGLLNFIMSNAAHVEILSPPALAEAVSQEAAFILKKFKKT